MLSSRLVAVTMTSSRRPFSSSSTVCANSEGLLINETVVATIETKFFLKGFINPAEALDTGVIETQKFIDDALTPANKLGMPGLLNVRFVSSDLVPLDVSNDNVVRSDVVFACDGIINLG